MSCLGEITLSCPMIVAKDTYGLYIDGYSYTEILTQTLICEDIRSYNCYSETCL